MGQKQAKPKEPPPPRDPWSEGSPEMAFLEREREAIVASRSAVVFAWEGSRGSEVLGNDALAAGFGEEFGHLPVDVLRLILRQLDGCWPQPPPEEWLDAARRFNALGNSRRGGDGRLKHYSDRVDDSEWWQQTAEIARGLGEGGLEVLEFFACCPLLNKQDIASLVLSLPAAEESRLNSPFADENLPAVNGAEEEFFRLVIDRHGIKDLPIEESLRWVLSTCIYLPGEAQLIDRLISGWAQAVQASNPSVRDQFPGDVLYVLAFSFIMLSTDAHTPAVKQKMTFDQFMGSMRGMNDGEDLDPASLRRWYDSLTTRRLDFSGDSGKEPTHTILTVGAPRAWGSRPLPLPKSLIDPDSNG